MNLNSIDALLEALKRTEGAARKGIDLGKAKPVAVKVDMLRAIPAHDDAADDEEATGTPDDDAMAAFKGMGNAVKEMGDESERRNYAPAPMQDDTDIAPAHHAAIVGRLQSDYPHILQSIMDELS